MTRAKSTEPVQITLRFDGWEVKSFRPKMSDKEFEQFCQDNPYLQIEVDPFGNIVAEPPVSYGSGGHESEVGIDLGIWNRHTKLGKTFSSSTMFTLPDGSKRMPDAAWVSMEKHQKLTPRQRKTFARVVPDFVVEVRSPSDDPEVLKRKMTDVWIANGVRLAWLIDGEQEKSWIFRADGSSEGIEGFDQKLSGEDVLPGFEFDLKVLIG